MLFCTNYLMSRKPVEPFLWGSPTPTPKDQEAMIYKKEKKKKTHQNPQYFFLKGSNFVQKVDGIKSESDSAVGSLYFPAPNWHYPSRC